MYSTEKAVTAGSALNGTLSSQRGMCGGKCVCGGGNGEKEKEQRPQLENLDNR